MGFLWPWLLMILPLAGLAVHLYRRGLEPPARTAVLHPDLALVARADERRRGWRRHLPAALYLVAVALALVASARPTFPVPEAHPGAGIVLALDVSRSMHARDVLPDRFEAAREALRAFVRELPDGTRVGLVTFAGYATPVVALTDDHQRLLDAVDSLSTDFGTVVGDALLASLRALPSLAERESLSDDPRSLATIILLTDGRSVGGVEPLLALEEVRRQQVVVHAIGVGTDTSGPIPGIPDRMRDFARFDEETLRAVADGTGGRYVFVDSAAELRAVYRDLGRSLVWRWRHEEATALVALGAAAVLLLSLGLAGWRRRLL